MSTKVTQKALLEIKDVTPDDAKRILWVWKKATREELLAKFPDVARHNRQAFSSIATIGLRRLAINAILRTHGIEYLGESTRTGKSVYYCNAGETYASTVLFNGTSMRVGNCGDLVESGSIGKREDY